MHRTFSVSQPPLCYKRHQPVSWVCLQTFAPFPRTWRRPSRKSAPKPRAGFSHSSVAPFAGFRGCHANTFRHHRPHSTGARRQQRSSLRQWKTCGRYIALTHFIEGPSVSLVHDAIRFSNAAAFTLFERGVHSLGLPPICQIDFASIAGCTHSH